MKTNSLKLIAQTVDIYPGDGKHPYARTGELGYFHLKKAGATGAILGHSEISESPEIINKKLISVFKEGLKNNIVLLGESWEEIGKDWNECSNDEKEAVKKIVKDRLSKILENINKDITQATIFGYEPGWGTRGSGKEDVPPPGPDQIEALTQALRQTISELYGQQTSQEARIIYGGSSSPERTKEIMPIVNIDGLILGSAGTTTAWVKQIGDSIIKITKVKQSRRKPILALNWKAYILQESYDDFLKVVQGFGKNIEVYLSPPATDLYELRKKLK